MTQFSSLKNKQKLVRACVHIYTKENEPCAKRIKMWLCDGLDFILNFP